MSTTSEKIGSLPWLSIWGRQPLLSAIVFWSFNFGMMMLLVFAMEGKHGRDLYRSWIPGDCFFLPLYVFAGATLVRSFKPNGAFYTQRWWHFGLLLTGVAISLLLEVMAVKTGGFSIAQELSPSKLYHTLTFPVMFYWAGSLLIPAIMSRRPSWALVLMCIGLAGWAASYALDWVNPHERSGHIEWSWSTMTGSPRPGR